MHESTVKLQRSSAQSRRCLLHPWVPRHSVRGITMLELLIAIFILGILFGVAIPAVSNTVEASRAVEVRADLMKTFLAALDGATIANVRTVMCPSPNSSTCVSSMDWSNGWIAFVDTNGDREHQAGESILSSHQALPGKVRLHSTAGRTRLVIQPSGSTAGSNVTFTICDGRGAGKAEALILSNRSVLRVGVPLPIAVEETCVH